MEAIIEQLIELYFDEPALQRTPTILNQANIDSVVFSYKIYKGSKEIDYLDFSKAELVFQKKGGVNVIDYGVLNVDGITYQLNRRIFDVVGDVTGYVNLYTEESLSATLHYSFKIISDLLNLPGINEFYVATIEQLVNDFNITVGEAKEILEALQGESFVGFPEFIKHVNNENDNEQHLIKDGENYLLPDGRPIGDDNGANSGGLGDAVEVDDDGMLRINGEAQNGYLTEEIKDARDTGFEKLEKLDMKIAGISNPSLLINGNFNNWQRALSQTGTGYGSDDRWVNNHVNAVKIHTRELLEIPSQVPGAQFYSRTTITNSGAGLANTTCVKLQRIEDVRRIPSGPVTVSFYARANAPRNIAIEFSQHFGTGGSPTLNGIGVKKIPITTSWEKHSFTADIPSIDDKIIGDNNHFLLFFWFSSGSNFDERTDFLGAQDGVFDIAQVKLEVGERATPFVPRPIGEELALCQRYYQQLGPGQGSMRIGHGFVNPANTVHVFIPAATTMRLRAPTITISGALRIQRIAGDIQVSSVSNATQGNQNMFDMAVILASNAVAGDMVPVMTNDADAKIMIDAEL